MNIVIFATLLVGYCSAYHHEENHHRYAEPSHFDTKTLHLAEPKYHGPEHYPIIHKGVPLDTVEVQHARAEHFAAIAKAKAGAHYAPEYHHEPEHHHEEPAHHYEEPAHHYEEPAHHYVEEHQPKYHGPEHYPVIKNGVPVDTPEVQHATAEHLAAHAEEESKHGYGHHEESQYHH